MPPGLVGASPLIELQMKGAKYIQKLFLIYSLLFTSYIVLVKMIFQLLTIWGAIDKSEQHLTTRKINQIQIKNNLNIPTHHKCSWDFK